MSDQVPGGPPPSSPTPPAPPAGASAPVQPSTGGQAPPPGASAPVSPPPGASAPVQPSTGGQAPPPGGMMPPAGYGASGMGTGMGYRPRPATPGIAIAGFICSLLGISLIGVILSVIGRKKAREIGASTGLATAGIWIGVAGMIFWLLWVILIIIAIAAGDTTTTTDYTYLISPLLW